MMSASKYMKARLSGGAVPIKRREKARLERPNQMGAKKTSAQMKVS